MLNRFQSFLREEFKGLPNTKEVSDFKDELLGNLMEKAEELKLKKSMSEDEIYEKCIKSISGFEETLKELKGKPVVVRDVKKVANNLLYVMMYFILLVGVYLAVSFTSNRWGVSWLIIVEGAFLFVATMLIVIAIKAFGQKKYTLARAVSMPVSLIIVTGVFLAVSMLMNIWATSWILFLFLPVFIIAIDIMIAAFAGKNKIIIPETMAGIMLLSVMAYVALGFLGILSWHPYWLIIVAGLFINLGIFAFYLKKKV
ncbi:MAG: hypothetical protein ACOCWI_01230 [Bacillota bacterium]